MGVYFGLVGLALALFFLRLPRQRSIGGGGRARRAAHATRSFVRGASGALAQRVASLPALVESASGRMRDSLPRGAADPGPGEPAAAAAPAPDKTGSGRVKRIGGWELSWGGGGSRSGSGNAVAADATAAAAASSQQRQP